jgi:peptide/nickel transport system permease protein
MGHISNVIRRQVMINPTLLGASQVMFVLTTLIPGDPALVRLGNFATAEQLQHLRQEMGLTRPPYERYALYLGGLLRGDLGHSWRTGKAYGILGVAMPLFWGGLVLVYVFYFKLGIAPPPTGRIAMLVSPPRHITGSYFLDSLLTGDVEALLSSVAHLVLPVITLALVAGASIARMAYTSMRKILASQFILVSHAYGLSPHTIVYKFALKNALLPVVTLIGLQVGFLIGGVVLVEVVFSLPGIGRYAVESLLVNDFAPVQGFVLLVLVVYLLVNLLVDLLYSVLNPQVQHG